MIKPIQKNITLENVKKSNYWDLIAILVWNHYSEKRFQDESQIEIKESYCGKSTTGSATMFSNSWDNPDYKEDGWIRTLYAVKIIFTRSDYVTHISINVTGNISIFGLYTDKNKTTQPTYYGLHQTISIVNWLIKNKFVKSQQ